MSKKGLGKGLGALIVSTEQDSAETAKSGVVEIDINKIEPNIDQPRKHFDDVELGELSESIKQFGVIQPIIVKEEDGFYKIIAGERRWRAARIANIKKIPVIIREYNDSDILQIALIENIQRKDLNPIEEAMCFKRLMDEYFLTQEDLAEKVSKSRNSISYSVNLLNLDKRVQNFLIEVKLTSGHARPLLLIKDPDTQFEAAEHIIDEEKSVREAEKYVKELLSQKKDIPIQKAEKPPHVKHIETDLSQLFGAKVNIKDGKNRGKIEIEYYSNEEFERLLGLFNKI